MKAIFQHCNGYSEKRHIITKVMELPACHQKQRFLDWFQRQDEYLSCIPNIDGYKTSGRKKITNFSGQ